MEVYLDNSATTPICPEAVKAMNYAITDCWGNPSSLYKIGTNASKVLEDARVSVASALSCDKEEIFFTSGGTESNNLAILGVADAHKRRGSRVIISSIEHSSIEDSARYLENQGFDVIRLRVDSLGRIDERQLFAAVDQSTILVSMMLVNNEVGTIEPVESIRKAIKKSNSQAVIHCDAVQAFGKIPLNPYKMGIDLMSVSSHKIHGPKGAGAIFIKKGTKIVPRTFGGLQESKIRPGTEPMPAIAGFGAAVNALPDIKSELIQTTALRDYFTDKLLKMPGIVLNSPPNALPYVTNISVLGIPSEVLINFLSDKGIYVSGGSACSKGHKSRVLKEMGLKPQLISSAIRISMSRYTVKEDLDAFIDAVTEAQKTIYKKNY